MMTTTTTTLPPSFQTTRPYDYKRQVFDNGWIRDHADVYQSLPYDYSELLLRNRSMMKTLIHPSACLCDKLFLFFARLHPQTIMTEWIRHRFFIIRVTTSFAPTETPPSPLVIILEWILKKIDSDHALSHHQTLWIDRLFLKLWWKSANTLLLNLIFPYTSFSLQYCIDCLILPRLWYDCQLRSATLGSSTYLVPKESLLTAHPMISWLLEIAPIGIEEHRRRKKVGGEGKGECEGQGEEATYVTQIESHVCVQNPRIVIDTCSEVVMDSFDQPGYCMVCFACYYPQLQMDGEEDRFPFLRLRRCFFPLQLVQTTCCHHTFCTVCVGKWIETCRKNENTFHCAYCRQSRFTFQYVVPLN